jgi:hypothetical protein
MKKEIVVSGNVFKFGCALAIIVSYVKWHSIGWALFHGVCSWVYILYYLICY